MSVKHDLHVPFTNRVMEIMEDEELEKEANNKVKEIERRPETGG